ncbi:uncharacterized protein EI90DRAFT_3146926 [Cantharellus anzutake]|uniref:uncharacterized protein n=1 Tax=Cantharellus anzutake TaxID=1750568 RepID=UPI00190769A7|nr:uncharacterized protein EI90DRAFT_3146926 [Cantharellus anzutake]KAF8324347.1 hypothetical protein EI90DRAFT_3146926 [Cantharellus anzutake]
MTSRLKRKLDSIGVDASSPKATESFCLIGTPLPPLEKSKDKNEFVPVWKQEARDEKGRRRLHGAFQGGFSAGYYNTVGSKEGWTPSTFKSSRTARAQNKVSRPEDFMDEEDLEELRESQKMVDTSEQMDLFGTTEVEMRKRAGIPLSEDDPMASTIASSILPPPQDSAGAQLLKKLGWRVGQGVGPRVTYEQLRKQDLASSTLLTSSVLEHNEEDEEARKHLYAPRDTKLTNLQPKGNLFGIGYLPGTSLSDMVGAAAESNQSRPRISGVTSGFGLGALNEAEEDDLDIYDTGPGQRASTRLAYDMDGRDNKLVTDGHNHDRGQVVEPQAAPTNSTRTFHDGRAVLPGFVLVDKALVETTWFKIPDVPVDWKPDPSSVWALTPQSDPRSGVEHQVPRRPDDLRWTASGKTAAERGEQLGEIGVPNQQPRSVFDYLSQKDRERLQGIRNAGVGDGAPPSSASVAIVTPPLEPAIAQAALRGFQPFSTDESKQSRYTTYIQSQLYPSNSPDYIPPPTPRPGQSNEDFNAELESYAKAAMIFKPMSGAMANRFTSASVVEAGPTLQGGLSRPSLTSAPPVEQEAAQPKEEPNEETPKQNAARLGMYGQLTREVKEWAPARLLCKRMGIKTPRLDAGGGEEGPLAAASSEEVSKSSKASSWDPASLGGTVLSVSTAEPSGSATRSGPKDISNIGLGEDDNQGKDTLTYQRPSMDIFKAIFASDEESDDDGEIVAHVNAPVDTSSTLFSPESGSGPSGPSTPSLIPPSTSSNPSGRNITVDASTFHPKFVPKSQREGRISSRKFDSIKHGSTSKKRRKALVSFDLDEEGKRDKKKGRNKEHEGDRGTERENAVTGHPAAAIEVDEEMEWVEKEASSIVNTTVNLTSLPSLHTQDVSKRPGRMRAADFM